PGRTSARLAQVQRHIEAFAQARCGNRARLIRVCRTTATTMAPLTAASARTRAGKTIAAIPPEMFDPIARWLPGAAPDDVARTRNLPGAAICKWATAVPSREPIW